MAFSVVGAGETRVDTVTGFTVTKEQVEALCPSGLWDGHMILVAIASEEDSDWNNWNIPSGFISGGYYSTSGDDTHVRVWWQVVDDVSALPSYWTFSNGNTRRKILGVAVLDGISESMNVSGGDKDVDYPGAHTPKLYTTVDDCIVIAAGCTIDKSGVNGSTVVSEPIGYDTILVEFSTSGFGLALQLGYHVAATAGGTPGRSRWTLDMASSSDSCTWLGAFVAGPEATPPGGGGTWSGEILATVKDHISYSGDAGELLGVLRDEGATSHEVVGALNELNGTAGVGFEKALRTYLNIE